MPHFFTGTAEVLWTADLDRSLSDEAYRDTLCVWALKQGLPVMEMTGDADIIAARDDKLMIRFLRVHIDPNGKWGQDERYGPVAPSLRCDHGNEPHVAKYRDAKLVTALPPVPSGPLPAIPAAE